MQHSLEPAGIRFRLNRKGNTVDLSRVRTLAEEWQGKCVAVIGDLMLDRYVWGNASRISPEAPVPIVKVERTTSVPGGAANVLRNLANLGACTMAFAVIGSDERGQELLTKLRDFSVDVSCVLSDAARPTTEKVRILAGNQQVVRVDTEQNTPLSQEYMQMLLERIRIEVAAGRIDAIVVEDYAKGLVSRELLFEVVAVAQKHGLPVALDPHPANRFRVQGLSLITPNRSEAFALAGRHYVKGVLPIADDTAFMEVAARLQEEWGAAHLLVTLGADGMILFDRGTPSIHVPTNAIEVFDVSGAGDTVIASFVLSLAGGATPQEAAVLSNHAAGVVVSKVGTVPIHLEELMDSFTADSP